MPCHTLLIFHISSHLCYSSWDRVVPKVAFLFPIPSGLCPVSEFRGKWVKSSTCLLVQKMRWLFFFFLDRRALFFCPRSPVEYLPEQGLGGLKSLNSSLLTPGSIAGNRRLGNEIFPIWITFCRHQNLCSVILCGILAKASVSVQLWLYIVRADNNNN